MKETPKGKKPTKNILKGVLNNHGTGVKGHLTGVLGIKLG